MAILLLPAAAVGYSPQNSSPQGATLGAPMSPQQLDKLIGGFGLVAWPAEYEVTGIHTFIVNQDGVVYQNDIAPSAGKPPPPITRFDPDRSWKPVG